VLGVRGQIVSGQIFSSDLSGGKLGYGDFGGGLVRVRFTLPGDTNLDGSVTVADLGALSTSYGATSGAVWSQGDFDFNGTVDVADLGGLATTYGTSLAGGPAATGGTMIALPIAQIATTVPEPALLLPGTAVLATLLTRRRRGLE
jgi:hypothetical protein